MSDEHSSVNSEGVEALLGGDGNDWYNVLEVAHDTVPEVAITTLLEVENDAIPTLIEPDELEENFTPMQ